MHCNNVFCKCLEDFFLEHRLGKLHLLNWWDSFNNSLYYSNKRSSDYMWLWINLNWFYYPSIVLSFECVVCLLWNWISYISISPLSFLNCHSGFFLFPCIYWKHLCFLKKLHLRFTRSYIIFFFFFLFCFCLCFLQGWSTIPISSFVITTQIAVLWFKVIEAERE